MITHFVLRILCNSKIIRFFSDNFCRMKYPIVIQDLTADFLGGIDSIDNNTLTLIYQSGYLTVKDYDEEFGLYHLGFPNKEVERGFTRFLIPYYTTLTSRQCPSFISSLVKEIRAGQPNQFMQRLDALFADGDYQSAGDAELYFQNAVWVIFKMVGLYTEVEHHISDGRIDLLIKVKLSACCNSSAAC